MYIYIHCHTPFLPPLLIKRLLLLCTYMVPGEFGSDRTTSSFSGGTKPSFFTGYCQNFLSFRLRGGKVHIFRQLHNPKNSSLFYDGQIFSSLELPLITKCRWPSSFKSVNSNMFVNKKQCFQRDLSSQITTTLVDCPTQLFCTWIFICSVA